MTDDNDCIICFTDISVNSYVKLDCCKQLVHIECLNTWIKTNINNKHEIRKCIYCRGNNDYIDTIIYYTRLEEANTTNYDLESNSLFEPQNNNYRIYIRQDRICMILFNLFCFIIVIIITVRFVMKDERNARENRSLLSNRLYFNN